MEKFKQLTQFSVLSAFVHRIFAGSTAQWRIILGFMLIVVIVVGIIAWFVFGWATEEPVTPMKSRARQQTLSIEDLRAVIALYQKKVEDHASLQRSVPEAPAFGRGSGVQ